MLFNDILTFLLTTFEMLYDTTADVIGFLSSSVGFGEYEMPIGVVLFGAYFQVWIIYKIMPVT